MARSLAAPPLTGAKVSLSFKTQGTTMQNWAGNIRFQPARVIVPNGVEEICDAVQAAMKNRSVIRVVGAKHSFSPLIQTDSTIIDPVKLSGLISVDREAETATFWAGTPISAMGPALAPHQLALSNQGDIDHQSISGAVSTGTHGTGINYGSLSSMVTALEYINGNGEVCSVDESTAGNLLSAFQVGLGVLGILTKVTIRCERAFILEEVRTRTNLDSCLADLMSAVKKHRHFEFFWFPYSDLVQIKTLNNAEILKPRSKISRIIGDEILEKALYRLICDVTAAFPRLSRPTSRMCSNLIPETKFSNLSYKVYPSARDVRFTEMEYAVPLEDGIRCFQEIRSMIEREKIKVFFPVEFRVAAADTAWISPFYGRQSAIISLHVYKSTDQDRYFRNAEAIFKSFSGRPHWGKMHNLTAGEISERYVKWPEFKKLRADTDPSRIFINKMLDAYL